VNLQVIEGFPLCLPDAGMVRTLWESNMDNNSHGKGVMDHADMTLLVVGGGS
jgi:hypothetical protein